MVIFPVLPEFQNGLAVGLIAANVPVYFVHLINIILCFFFLSTVHGVVLFVFVSDDLVENLLIGEFLEINGAKFVTFYAEDH